MRERMREHSGDRMEERRKGREERGHEQWWRQEQEKQEETGAGGEAREARASLPAAAAAAWPAASALGRHDIGRQARGHLQCVLLCRCTYSSVQILSLHSALLLYPSVISRGVDEGALNEKAPCSQIVLNTRK